MKKILALLAGILFLMVGICQAAPFLVCDPQAGVTKYILDIDGVETTTISAQADGSIRYDMVV